MCRDVSLSRVPSTLIFGRNTAVRSVRSSVCCRSADLPLPAIHPLTAPRRGRLASRGATAASSCVRFGAERTEAREHHPRDRVGLAGTLLAFAYTVPQLRSWSALARAAGVSVAALANSTISGIAWTTYGVVEHELWVTAAGVLALPATAGALVLAWRGGGAGPAVAPGARGSRRSSTRPRWSPSSAPARSRRARLLGRADDHARGHHRLAQPRRVGDRRVGLGDPDRRRGARRRLRPARRIDANLIYALVATIGSAGS